MRKRGEDALQRAIVQWLRLALRSDVRFWHTPNGGGRTKVEASIFKGLGVQAGIPDLAFVWSDGQIITLRPGLFAGGAMTSRIAFIEVKTPTGSLSAVQRDFRDFCLAGGIPWALVRTLDQAIEQVKEWGLTKVIREER